MMRRNLRGMTADSGKSCAALDQWLDRHPALRNIAVYSPLPGEVDLLPTLQLHPDRRWLYPKVCHLELTFHEVKNPDAELVPGAFQLLEPIDELPEFPIREIDAFLCPGLAFDSHGGRLGRGRGFYDRMLAKARPDAIKVGVCFEFQQVDDTFPEAHDILMDEVIF